MPCGCLDKEFKKLIKSYRLYIRSADRSSGTHNNCIIHLNAPQGVQLLQGQAVVLLRELYLSSTDEPTSNINLYWSVPMPTQLVTGSPNPNLLGTIRNESYSNAGGAVGTGGITHTGSVWDSGMLCANPFSQDVNFQLIDAAGTTCDDESWVAVIDVGFFEQSVAQGGSQRF